MVSNLLKISMYDTVVLKLYHIKKNIKDSEVR